MSRIPQPSSSAPRSPKKPSSLAAPTSRIRPKPPPSPTPTPTSRARPKPPPSPTPTPTLRPKPSLKSIKPSKSPVRRAPPLPSPDDVPLPKPLSIKEQIALKRAEAKKQGRSSPASGSDFGGIEDADPIAASRKRPNEDAVDLGRWSVKETVERARSSGALNLASRALPCLPSLLFEIHLGIKPEPLKSVPSEPPVSSPNDTGSQRKTGQHAPSWYESHDLEIIKAWSNEIVEIQPELSMFGSLKHIDLHNNQLTSLPSTFPDLTALTLLDLSHNQLTSLPDNLFALPALITLNISHNELTALPFRAPFDAPGANPLARTKDVRGDWFAQSITRATAPLPRLATLDASHNHLQPSAIDHAPDSLPSQVTKLDLSANPLGDCKSLLRSLAHLDRLRELRLAHADIGNDSFPVDLFAPFDHGAPFPSLCLLDMEETQVTRPVIEASFGNPAVKQELDFEVTMDEPRQGTMRVILGKRVIKEAWELEAERRMKARAARNGNAHMESSIDFGGRASTSPVRPSAREQKPPAKPVAAREAWEIEAEQGLLTEGAKRRARAAAAAAQLSVSPGQAAPRSPTKSAVVQKEAWEIEAEQGLLTAGGQRRARAAAVATNTQARPPPEDLPSTSPSPSNAAAAMSSPQFYDSLARTLTLPPSAPPPKSTHNRSFSAATPSWGRNAGLAAMLWSKGSASDLALAIPVPTLPLAAISAQPLSHNLKILVLSRRKQDPSFTLPSAEDNLLPLLEELTMEGCSLGDAVPVARAHPDSSDDFSTPRTSEPVLPLLARLFPSLRTLDLSYNALTSAALTQEALAAVVLAEEDRVPVRRGLRHLRLRGNHVTELDGFQGLAAMFKGNRDVPNWKLEELDVRDNEVGRLPPEVGLLPLDVLLVDGNVFRIPARRVWEREGTKGLLGWLRGRIE